MTTKSSKEEESPLKPIPFDELIRMLNLGQSNIKSEETKSEISMVQDDLDSNVLDVSSDNNLSKEETDYFEVDDFNKHDLSPIKENMSIYANDSGYGSNRTSCSSYSTNRLSMINTTESHTGGFHEVSSRKNLEFLTPAQRARPLTLSALKTTNSSRFESFVAPNKMYTHKTLLFNNNIQSRANTPGKERVLFQCTPSSKLHNLNTKSIRKPLFIPTVITSNNNQSYLTRNDSIPNPLSDVSVTTCDLLNPDNYEFIKVKQSQYIKGNLIGRGGSCEVYHCFDPTQKVSRAIKVVNLNQNDDTAVFYKNEVELLQNLQHSGRIVKLYDYEIVDTGFLYMVLEIGGKDIDKILKQLAVNTSNLPFYKILYYWMEMLYCVRDIHNIGIVHSDLKPANFLMAENGIKLIDFGIAAHLQADMTSAIRNSVIGSLNYISPEALKCDQTTLKYKITFKSDIWSLGCILYQLVYKRAPFQPIINMYAKIAAITNKNHRIEYPSANWIPPGILETIRKCLQFNANLRPSIEELIAEYETCNFK